MKSAIFCALCSFLGLSAVSASVTLNFTLGQAFDSSGNPVAVGTVGVLVANTGDGILPTQEEFVTSVLSSGSFIGDSRILGVVQASDFTLGGQFGFSDTFEITDLTGLTMGTALGTAGTDLAFYWFPGITTVGATVGEGQSYGFYRSDVVDTDASSEMSYNMPSDGAFLSLATLDTSLGGSTNVTELQANFTAQTIPEPSRMLFLGMAMVGLVFRRRR